ncbi:hypothetical protein PX74_003753 [Salmonella enterica subsp. enterica]|nr:hypothetical protein [Salmonella enterica subsp. enterica]
MSKLLDLLAQQKALEEQINKLKEDAKEAKVLKVVEGLEVIRTQHDYSIDDFVDAVLSYYRPSSTLKNAKNGAVKKPRAKQPQFEVEIDGVKTIIQAKKSGILEKALKDKGFATYEDYISHLIKSNEAANFDDLIKKLNGKEVQAL